MNTKAIRKDARDNLKYNWKKSLLFLSVFFVTQFLISWMLGWIENKTRYQILIICIRIILIVSMNYGITLSFLNLKRGDKTNCLYFIYYTFKYLEKVWYLIGKLIIKLLIYIVPLLLSMYLFIMQIFSYVYGYGINISFFIGIIGIITFGILFIIQILYYILSPYVLYDNEGIKSKNILKESKRLMKKNIWNLIKTMAPFILYYLLVAIVGTAIIVTLYFAFNINNYATIYIVYLLAMFVQPYQYITIICFYEKLKNDNPKVTNEKKNNKKKKK